MRICQVAVGETRLPPQDGGGADNFIFQIAKHLAGSGHQVILLDRRHLPTDPATEYAGDLTVVRLRGRRVDPASRPRIPTWLRLGLNEAIFAAEVRKHLRDHDEVDVVHIHSSTFIPILTLANRGLRGKLVFTSHTPRRLMDPPGITDRLALGLEDRFLSRVAKVTALNEAVAERVSRAAAIPMEDIAVLPVGVDTDEFAPAEAAPDIQEKYGIGKGRTVLFVGRITHLKGVEYLVRAMDSLVHERGHSDLRCLLVGPIEGFGSAGRTETPYLRKIAGMVRESGLQDSVVLTGPVSRGDLRKLYAACSIFVLPSLSEATPTVVLEAMACGKPVVASRVGGIPEQVQEGKSGFLVPPGDAEALAHRIKYLLDHPQWAQAMGACGRRLVEEKFTWEHIARKVVQIYERG